MPENYDPADAYITIYKEQAYRNEIPSAFTDVIASGQGTTTATMTTHTEMVTNEHIGRTFTDTSDDIKYTIISNATSTITLDSALGGTADTNTCSVTKDAKVLRGLAFDMTRQVDSEDEIAQPMRVRVRKWVIGEGRGVSRIVELGFGVGESSHEFKTLTGIFMYYALGGCSTTGTAHAPAVDLTSTATSGNTITVTGEAWAANVYAGDMVVVTGGADNGSKYGIISNTGDVLTIHKAHSMGATDNFSIQTAPFTHTITEADTLPSFSMHIEFENATDANSIRIDLLGCIIKSLTYSYEAGSETPVMTSIEISCSKDLEGEDIAKPSPLEKIYIVKQHVDTFTLTYDSANIEANLIGDACDQHSWKIVNEFDIKDIFGDEYPKKVLIGQRSYELTFHIYTTVRTWYDISRLKIPSYASEYGNTGYYATAIVYQMKVQRDSDDYIQTDMTKLEMNPEGFKNKFFNRESKKLNLDINFADAPGNAGSGVVKDDLSIEYYEG